MLKPGNMKVLCHQPGNSEVFVLIWPKNKGKSRERNAGAPNALIRLSNLDSAGQNMTLPALRRAAASFDPYYQRRIWPHYQIQCAP